MHSLWTYIYTYTERVTYVRHQCPHVIKAVAFRIYIIYICALKKEEVGTRLPISFDHPPLTHAQLSLACASRAHLQNVPVAFSSLVQRTVCCSSKLEPKMSDDKLDAILNDYDLVREDLLNAKCKQSLLDRMAKEIVGDWNLVGRALSVEPSKLKAIKKDNVNASEPEEKALAMLDEWSQQYGNKATYLKLVEGFLLRNNRSWVEIVCEEVVDLKKSHQKTKPLSGPSSTCTGSSYQQGDTHCSYNQIINITYNFMSM